ncbi:MAG: recombinase RecA [Candidatus Paceibacterota bacterium]
MAKKKNINDLTVYDESRSEALDAFLGSMAKEKPGSVLRLNDAGRTKIDVVPTGAISLDLAIGAGGFPRGKIIELYGGEGGGKTTVALTVAANAQALGGNIGFVDAEHGLNRELAQNIGIDPNRFVVYQPDSGEDAIDMVENMIKSKAFDVIIVDSVAAMTPKAEIDGDVEQQFMGLHARLMSRFMRRVASIANENGVMLILINQVRKNLAAYGTPDETTGGKAIKFYSSLRIEVKTTSSKKITHGNDIVGHTVTATVKKNRLGAPHTQAEFDIIYGKGVDGTGSLLDVAERLGILSRSGAYYTEVATGERLSEVDAEGRTRAVVGKEAVKSLLRRDALFAERLKSEIRKILDEGVTISQPSITAVE